MVGWRANQKPTNTPAIEPITKASIDSESVIQRCFQIMPSANSFTTRAATSYGVEKKNGGSTSVPKIGTVVNSCHRPIAMTATSACNRRRLRRFTIDLLPSRLSSRGCRPGSERVLEQADQAGRALGVTCELLHQLRLGEAGRQRLGVEVGRDQSERVVVRRAGRRARAEIGALPRSALAADIFLGRLAGLALGEAGHRRRNAISEPMIDAEAAATLRIDHEQHVADGAGRRVRP